MLVNVNLMNLDSNKEEKKDYQPLMALVGPAGYGKTTFLAKFILDLEVDRNRIMSYRILSLLG